MTCRFPRLTLLLSLLAGLVGCGEAEGPVPPPPVRPVKTLLIEAPEIGFVRTFPGRIEAARRADLAFRVSGKLAELPFKEGEEVTAGAVVARLDPTDYQIVYNDRKATFDRAKADYDRGRQLVEQGTISRRDFDALVASFKSAEAALQAAQQDLDYTRLEAPFAGVVARRYLDNFEEVQAREPVLALNDTTQLEVKVDIPEALMQRVRRVDPEARKTQAYATFDTEPDRRYQLEFKEVATRADPKTQTFEVTMTMPPPEGLTILSGMTTSVVVDTRQLRPEPEEGIRYYIPAAAVTGDTGLQPMVWIVDEAMTVEPRGVTIGSMQGDAIEVTDGLQPGDRIVVAGAAYLAPGMQVRLLPESEQPASNPR
jgi:RND family efflux transporter MFP subunit